MKEVVDLTGDEDERRSEGGQEGRHLVEDEETKVAGKDPVADTDNQIEGESVERSPSKSYKEVEAAPRVSASPPSPRGISSSSVGFSVRRHNPPRVCAIRRSKRLAVSESEDDTEEEESVGEASMDEHERKELRKAKRASRLEGVGLLVVPKTAVRVRWCLTAPLPWSAATVVGEAAVQRAAKASCLREIETAPAEHCGRFVRDKDIANQFIPCGIYNAGNSCYFNCLLQIFYHLSPKFQAALYEIPVANKLTSSPATDSPLPPPPSFTQCVLLSLTVPEQSTDTSPPPPPRNPTASPRPAAPWYNQPSPFSTTVHSLWSDFDVLVALRDLYACMTLSVGRTVDASLLYSYMFQRNQQEDAAEQRETFMRYICPKETKWGGGERCVDRTVVESGEANDSAHGEGDSPTCSVVCTGGSMDRRIAKSNDAVSAINSSGHLGEVIRAAVFGCSSTTGSGSDQMQGKEEKDTGQGCTQGENDGHDGDSEVVCSAVDVRDDGREPSAMVEELAPPQNGAIPLRNSRTKDTLNDREEEAVDQPVGEIDEDEPVVAIGEDIRSCEARKEFSSVCSKLFEGELFEMMTNGDVRTVPLEFMHIDLHVVENEKLDNSLRNHLHGTQGSVERWAYRLGPVLWINVDKFEYNRQTHQSIKVACRFDFPQLLCTAPLQPPSERIDEILKLQNRLESIQAEMQSLQQQQSQFAQQHDAGNEDKIIDIVKRTSSLHEQQEQLHSEILHAAESQDVLYRLQAVIIHSGACDGGHYWAYVYSNNRWYRIDDSTVSPSNWSELYADACGPLKPEPVAAAASEGGRSAEQFKWLKDGLSSLPDKSVANKPVANKPVANKPVANKTKRTRTHDQPVAKFHKQAADGSPSRGPRTEQTVLRRSRENGRLSAVKAEEEGKTSGGEDSEGAAVDTRRRRSTEQEGSQEMRVEGSQEMHVEGSQEMRVEGSQESVIVAVTDKDEAKEEEEVLKPPKARGKKRRKPNKNTSAYCLVYARLENVVNVKEVKVPQSLQDAIIVDNNRLLSSKVVVRFVL
eukprot:GHVS01055621.1.p1 GENE.GHVS01055621.1~~GHVS01055621.1.p1  ORF type:complete len:1032 (-),score=222.49 GHVS01055621.1:2433-5528(-)